MTNPLPTRPPAPTALEDAIGTLRVYDMLNAAERLERGGIILAEAQAYALIALAEEQRVANLIAYAVAQHANGSAMFNPDAVRDEIRERLGLA